MAKLLDSRTRDLGLYDSDTGKPLRTERVVEVTDHVVLEPGHRLLLLYATAKRGRIVQFVAENNHGGAAGMHVFLDEPESLAYADRFSRIHLDTSGERLIALARKHAPEVPDVG